MNIESLVAGVKLARVDPVSKTKRTTYVESKCSGTQD